MGGPEAGHLSAIPGSRVTPVPRGPRNFGQSSPAGAVCVECGAEPPGSPACVRAMTTSTLLDSAVTQIKRIINAPRLERPKVADSGSKVQGRMPDVKAWPAALGARRLDPSHPRADVLQ